VTQVRTVISGGKAGAYRAALDWAIEHDVPHGGWCPAGRRAEDGPLAAKYKLTEAESQSYRARTARNVRDSDAKLILNLGEHAAHRAKMSSMRDELVLEIRVG